MQQELINCVIQICDEAGAPAAAQGALQHPAQAGVHQEQQAGEGHQAQAVQVVRRHGGHQGGGERGGGHQGRGQGGGEKQSGRGQEASNHCPE